VKRDEPQLDDALQALETMKVPEGFADRVMKAREVRTQEAPVVEGLGSRVRGVADHRLVKWGATLVAAACVGLVWHAMTDPYVEPIRGSLTADSRQTVELGSRGVAVAEPASTLSWAVEGMSSARVEQKSGNVFYRVDPGGSFEVTTPRGVVTVTGTCFRVEVLEMKKDKFKGAAVGAALAATVVVTVYEGGVLFADKGDGGKKVELAAGDRLIVDRDGARVRPNAGEDSDAVADSALAPPAPDVTRDQLLARDEQQRKQIATLRKQLDARRAEPGGRDASEPDGRPWFDPSEQTLAKFAEECRVRYDLPPFDIGGDELPLSREVLEGMSFSDAELASMKKAYSAIRDSLTLEVRELYIEATGDTEGAGSLSMSAMGQELQHKSHKGESAMIHQRIARERAGQLNPPADVSKRSPLERYYRLLGGAGDAMEDALAQVIGKDRARELRTEQGGWGARMEFGGCSDDKEVDEER
jgi:ferric-dicitrate binding protein FerR (iron transport regulator)